MKPDVNAAGVISFRNVDYRYKFDIDAVLNSSQTKKFVAILYHFVTRNIGSLSMRAVHNNSGNIRMKMCGSRRKKA